MFDLSTELKGELTDYEYVKTISQIVHSLIKNPYQSDYLLRRH